MIAKNYSQMEQWEHDVDNINWKAMLHEIDEALADNLAAELGFPSFERLEQASELVAGEYYISHLSDGRWVWWNVRTYAKEDPILFQTKTEIMNYIAQFLNLDASKLGQLEEGISQVVQTKRCVYCEHEFNPKDPTRFDWDLDQDQMEYCSADCAMESVLLEMKDELGK